MDLYRQLYFFMFRASESAIRHLENGDPKAALQVLVLAQQEAEAYYLSETQSLSLEWHMPPPTSGW